jgi:MoaA/NifB/PqqE/SkfB family radical SAM enzyme
MNDPTKAVTPTRLRIEASSFCQLRCPSCPTTAGAIHPAVGSGYLKLEDFRDLLDENPCVTRVELSNYGEVFLNPNLLKILSYANDKGVAITLENGVNLNHVRDEALEGLVKYRVRAVRCSIDGASPETYRIYRIRGDFNSVIANIERINCFKQQYQSELPRLVWQFVVFGHNEHEIPAAREMAGRLGMEFRIKLSWDPDFSPIRNKDFVRLQTGSAITRAEHEQLSGKKYKSEICHQLWDNPQINWNGKVLGCCRNFWGDFGGNVFTDGLIPSLNNEKISYARDMLCGKKPPRDDIPCTTCEMYIAMRQRSKFMVQRGSSAVRRAYQGAARHKHFLWLRRLFHRRYGAV